MNPLTKITVVIALMVMATSHPCSSAAQSGTWNVDADGNWSDTSKWAGGIVANGANNTADFSVVPITAERTVTLDTSRTIGILNVGEASLSYYYQNFVGTNGSVLTLDNGGTMPVLFSSGYRQLYLPLAGANGLNLTNAISATLGSVLGILGSNSYSGVTLINTNIQVYPQSTNALGAATLSDGTIVNPGGSIFLAGSAYPAAEDLALSGSGFAADGQGALRSSGGTTRTWSGNIISSQTTQASIGVDTSGTLILTGTLTGGNSAYTEKVGGGTLVIAGNVPALSPWVSGGVLQIGNGGTTGNLVDNAYYGNYATIAFNRSDTYVWAPTTQMGGNGTIQAMGPGKLVISSYEPFHGNELSDPPTQALLISPGAVAETATFVPISQLTLNGGTLSATGGNYYARQSWALWNTVTVLSNAMTSVITSSGAESDIQLLDDPHATTFNVASGATNGVDLYVPAVLTHSYWDYGNFGTLIKTGPGTMVLAGNNLYQGGTTISGGTLLVNNTSGSGTGSGGVTVQNGGTLGGNGIISGAIFVQPGGTLSPGASIGKLTVGNLALGGTTLMEINKSSGLTNDSVASTGTLTYGGTLTVTNVGPAVSLGDSFTLFSPVGSGSFDSVVLPVLHGGLGWINNLAVDGSVTTYQAINPNPTSITSQLDGENLTLSWPLDHTGWQLQVQTNALNVGLSANWSVIEGSAEVNQMVVPVDVANEAVFYRLVLP
jgi:autotransporter-associated beta strand protein